MDNTIIQTYLTDTITQELASAGFTIWASKWKRWPGSSNPVWIYITSSNAEYFNDMVALTSDFEDYLFSLEQVSDVSVTSSSTIWEIEFKVDIKQAALLWLTEKDIFNQISTAVRWKTAWSLKWTNNDHDIKLYFDTFLDEVKPSDIDNINIYAGWKTIKAGSLVSYNITNTSPSIQRWDGDIQVWISASLIDSSTTSQVQEKLENFAKTYEFPKWISYKKWWENEENSDLINSVLMWIFITFFLIFAVLVYQFNSYGQPAVILYSVFMSIIWVIIWLYITWNPLSMPVWVWFISLMWIVVNDAIIMIDKFNNNLHKWMNLKMAITQWAVSRLNPILVTTLTTSAWIIPIALQDAFWAGLGFTIAFGLTTGSIMTLFTIPALYYMLSHKKHKIQEANEIKENKSQNFIKKHVYKIIGVFIILVVILFVTQWWDDMKKTWTTQWVEIKEIMQKARNWDELTDEEKVLIQEFRQQNQTKWWGKWWMRR
jgi:multidrug efflux pump subunit AcrB